MSSYKIILSSLVSALLCNTAYADDIEVELTGSVQSISSNQFGLSSGAPITYTFIFSESYVSNDANSKRGIAIAKDIAPVKCKIRCNDGLADFSDALFDFSVTIGTHSFSGKGGTLTIINNHKRYVSESGVDVIKIKQISEQNNEGLKFNLDLNVELDKDTLQDVNLTETLAQALITANPINLNFKIIEGTTSQRVEGRSDQATLNSGIVTHLASTVRDQGIDRLFEWAENAYPEVFTPGSFSQNISGWRYRFYSSTNNYVGVNDANEVYVLGGTFGGLIFVGSLDDLLSMIP